MIGLALTLALAAGDAADPLAPAWSGKVQCYAPDAARKTCVSIGGYTRGPNGAIDNRAVVLVAKSPLIVMETHTPVRLKAGGAVCGPMTQHDIEIAAFKINGAPAKPEEAQRLRAVLIQQMAPMFGHEACTTFTSAGDHFTAHATDNGKPMGPDMTVTWVSEPEYRVAP
ncbi:hypothetical protein [Phenylobacterium sp.]|jgi:hypothetical protein|uniref:hypothetical protein n=1 Tax=Phenylobacterium sp. TaxID=1871053 RepID=UPI002F3FD447